MEPDTLSNQFKSGKSFKERIKALLQQQNKNLPESELGKLMKEVSLYQQEMEKRSHDLVERVKELNCLYGLSLLIEKPDISTEELFQSLAELVTGSWQYPEITCARIIYDGKTFQTPNFKETPWKQSAPVLVNNEKKGTFDIFLLEEKPYLYEGPFLKEERNLIDTLTKNLGHYLEQKAMEKALRDSEENMRVTLQSLGDAVIATDTNGQITRMNFVAEELTGWKFNETTNRKIDEVFHIVNAFTGEKVGNPVSKVLKTGRLVGLANHTKLISKKGKEFQISDSAAPIKNDEGNVIGVVLVFRDVTEEYRMKEKLKASEERYRTVFENTGTAATILEKDGTISLANKQFARLSGYSIEEIENKKTWMEFVVPEDLARMKEQHELRRKNSESALKEYEFKIIDKNQNLKHIHLYIDMIPDTDKSVASLLDVTDRKKSDEALRESEQRFRRIYENIAIGLAQVSIDFKIIGANEAYCKMLGYSEHELIGKNLNAITHPEVLEENMQKQKLLATGKIDHYRMEKKFIHKNGKTLTGILDANLIRDADGHGIYFLGSVVDITERKQAETELKQKMEELETFNRAMVGRENRMIKLKNEVNELLEKLNQPQKYRTPDETDENQL